PGPPPSPPSFPTRRSSDLMAAILKDEAGQGTFPFLLHCFTAGPDLARTALDLGGYISFSGIVTFKNAEEIREVAKFVPADRYLVDRKSTRLNSSHVKISYA